ncbi:MAG: biotin--[acetyl-CoA-carboxylase] ligase [Eubacteriales bacterium]|nr:biotin--[acetyl-CoA-carboxylase] ligase [Eubacteriales bacterium]
MLDYNYLKEKLNTEHIGRSFIQFESLQSAAKKARIISPHSPNGMVVYTDTQWENKTKRDKVWFSPQGGVYISIILDLKVKKDYCSLLTLLGGTALYHTLKELGVTPILKWPNDVLIDDKKIGAVFVDNITCDYTERYILSINLNIGINRELFNGNLDSPAISLAEIYNSDIVTEDIIAMLLNQTDGLIADCFTKKNCQMIYEPWEQYISQFDNQVRLRKYGNKKWMECTIIGFNNSGELGFIQSNGVTDIIDPKKYEAIMIKESIK